MGKSVYALATLPKKDSTVSKPLAERIKTYWGTMLKQIRYLKFEEEREAFAEEIKRGSRIDRARTSSLNRRR